MRGILLQDWMTISAASTTTTVTQGASAWLDIARYGDVVAFTQIQSADPYPNVYLSYQGSPTRAAFATLLQIQAAAGSVQTAPLLRAHVYPTAPRFLRWQATGPTGGWDLTFRVWISAHR